MCTPTAWYWSRQRKEVVLPEPTARDARQDLGITEFGETLRELETQQRHSHTEAILEAEIERVK